jgi:DHA1 family tetracycline resistance protein-like MFS transporter
MLNPAAQALLSRSVPATEQGLLQGAMASVMTGSAMISPPIASGVFALAISSDAAVSLPGAPFFVGAALLLAALGLALSSGERRQRVGQLRALRAALP